MEENTKESLKRTREYTSQCTKDETQTLLELIPQLNENFEKAVDVMSSCKRKIIVTGVGKGGSVGARVAVTLSSTGTPAFYINPLDIYHGDLDVMAPDDVILALNNSGQTDELLRLLPMMLHTDVLMVSISGNPRSLLAKCSTTHITCRVEKETCPLNLAPTSNTMAALAMRGTLTITLMMVKSFKPNDFAQFHPDGELGKRLLTTVSDMMRSDNLPIIPKEMYLGDAIIHVSRGKLDLGVSLENKRVVGLITNGSIRCTIEKWQVQFFDRTVSDIMTASPKTIPPNTKITEVQAIIHKCKIHTILVVDSDNHLLEVVDHYSCML